MPLSPVSTYVHASFAKFTCSRFCFVQPVLGIWWLQINWIGLDFPLLLGGSLLILNWLMHHITRHIKVVQSAMHSTKQQLWLIFNFHDMYFEFHDVSMSFHDRFQSPRLSKRGKYRPHHQIHTTFQDAWQPWTSLVFHFQQEKPMWNVTC